MNNVSKTTAAHSGAKLRLAAAMTIFGTIGLFVRAIPLPSSVIAMVRGLSGALVLLLLLLIRRIPLSGDVIKRNLPLLLLSGTAIGFNWILLFEAYRYTTVATATLCYYFAPIFVLLLSPVLLGEALTKKKVLCILTALVGMVFVSGVPRTGLPSLTEAQGILFGLSAAVLYAFVVILNKKLREIGAFDMTIVQLGTAGAVLIPYCLLTEDLPALAGSLSLSAVGLLAVVGFVHTGLAYVLYFGSLSALPAQTAALFSYIDPVVAILLSALFLREPMTLLEGTGAVLVLGATLLSELSPRPRR